MKRFFLGSICVVAASVAAISGDSVSAAGADGPDPGSQQFYTGRVTQILQNNCTGCHDETAKGGLRLDSYAGIKKGGDDGVVIVPGDPDTSMLIQAIRRDGDLKMPPKHALDPTDVADLVAWVKAGAVGSDPAPAAGATAAPDNSAPAAMAPSGQASAKTATMQTDADLFENKVRPILVNSCGDCHSDSASGGFRLDSKAAFEKGGAHGAEIVPGDPDHSRLIQAVE
jgi:cytochrome c5